MRKKLILISGSPCVGKKAVGTRLFERYDNSAYLDGDWCWWVHPFSVMDPRLRNGENQYVLRVSALGDRTEEDYLAETSFVRYLAQNGAPVADVIPSIRGNLIEHMDADGKTVYVSLFAYAKGMLMADNGYRYREGATLEEYFFNIGKALGTIHRLSKAYTPVHQHPDYFDKYNMTYLDRLIPENYENLKKVIAKRLEAFHALPKGKGCYGLVHFDFSDGNYHIDMNTGDITVFDFDNCMYCWYMFDLANLWIHGTGWYQNKALDQYASCVNGDDLPLFLSKSLR